MSEFASSKKGYWILFGISAVVTLLLLVFANQWFWAGLPFLCTYLALSLDVL